MLGYWSSHKPARQLWRAYIEIHFGVAAPEILGICRFFSLRMRSQNHWEWDRRSICEDWNSDISGVAAREAVPKVCSDFLRFPQLFWGFRQVLSDFRVWTRTFLFSSLSGRVCNVLDPICNKWTHDFPKSLENNFRQHFTSRVCCLTELQMEANRSVLQRYRQKGKEDKDGKYLPLRVFWSWW